MARSATTFRSKWKSGETKVIRVPAKLAPKVLSYAQALDKHYHPSELHEPELPYRTAADVTTSQPVNVAAIPQRSPFRYPGGKTWLVPYIRSWLTNAPVQRTLLVEPFAGGAIVGLTAGFERLAEHVILVERDPNVAAVWQTIFFGQATWLADRICHFELIKKNVLKVLQ